VYLFVGTCDRAERRISVEIGCEEIELEEDELGGKDDTVEVGIGAREADG